MKSVSTTSPLSVPVRAQSAGRSDTPNPGSTPTPVDVVDFADGVNNPIEALVMPMADPVAALIVSNQFQSSAAVQVAIGDQRLNYTLSKPTSTEFRVPGEVNGQPFELKGGLDADTMSIKLTGEPAGEKLNVTLQVGAGEFVTTGTVGQIAFEQTTSLNVWQASVDIDGSVNGEPYKMSIGADAEGDTVGDGHLGSRPITLRVEQGPNGTVLVHQEIGNVRIEELISPL